MNASTAGRLPEAGNPARAAASPAAAEPDPQPVIDAAIVLLDRMRSHACAGRWGEVADLDAERVRLFGDLQSLLPAQAPTAALQRGLEILKSGHDELIDLGRAAREQLRLGLQQINKGRRAQLAYSGRR